MILPDGSDVLRNDVAYGNCSPRAEGERKKARLQTRVPFAICLPCGRRDMLRCAQQEWNEGTMPQVGAEGVVTYAFKTIRKNHGCERKAVIKCVVRNTDSSAWEYIRGGFRLRGHVHYFLFNAIKKRARCCGITSVTFTNGKFCDIGGAEKDTLTDILNR